MIIKRTIQSLIEERLFKGKAILVFGARQTGKSTLTEEILQRQKSDTITFNGDDADVRQELSNTTAARLKAIIGKNKLILIDEAQRIENIGLTLKIFTDQIRDVQVIATGSSPFELSGKVNESLTGRNYEYMLYPLSFGEMVNHHGLLEEKKLIEHRMIYGYYPEIVVNKGEETERLKLLASSYLYKDLLMLDQIKKPALLDKLLNALALQVGSEVNYTEIGSLIGSDRKTVEKYIDLLQKAFVLFELPAFAKNVRNEIKKGKKVFFYDCGIRNAVINNFKPLGSRTDSGALWENFVISERLKCLRNSGRDVRQYFWRTTQQQEIDLVEDENNILTGVEMKFGSNKKTRFPSTFLDNYSNSKSIVITPANVEEFIL